MNKMTVKDFIIYNSPCFSCGSSIVLKLRVKKRGSHKIAPEEFISFVINKDVIEIKLTVSYAFSLKLNIQYKTNKFFTNNIEKLKEYLNEWDCHLVSSCNQCNSIMMSEAMEFDFDTTIIKPLQMYQEYARVRVDNETDYLLHNLYKENKSVFTASTKPASYTGRKGENPKIFIAELPLIPLSKIKTRQKFINKLKTYLIFS